MKDDNYKLVLFPDEELEKMFNEEFNESQKEYHTFREEIITDINENSFVCISLGDIDFTVFKSQIIKVSVDYVKFRDGNNEIVTIPFERVVYYKVKHID